MPNLLMCEATGCYRAENCFRHASSGTPPDAGQRYGRFEPYKFSRAWVSPCSYYLPALNPDGSPRLHVQERWYGEESLGIQRAEGRGTPMLFLGAPPTTPEEQAEVESMMAEGWLIYGATGLRKYRKTQKRRAAEQRQAERRRNP